MRAVIKPEEENKEKKKNSESVESLVSDGGSSDSAQSICGEARISYNISTNNVTSKSKKFSRDNVADLVQLKLS